MPKSWMTKVVCQAYTAHDLDDGLRSGMITTEMLQGIELWEILTRSIAWHSSTLTDLDRHRLIRRLIGMEVTDLIETTDKYLKDNAVQSVEQLQKLQFNVVQFSADLSRRNRSLKDFLFTNLYRHPRVVRMAVKAERILTDLFTAYANEKTILPRHIQAQIPERGMERTICDYIAGMTDRFAIDEHQKLFDPALLP